MTSESPIRPTDDAARKLAQELMAQARFGALAVTDPETGTPYVARVATVFDEAIPLILISTLSLHTKALQADPYCSLLIGEPGEKGDPLTHPRMTIVARAETVDKAAMKERWLAAIPKSALYFDFTDFLMMRLVPSDLHLNAGFGKAFQLTAGDLA